MNHPFAPADNPPVTAHSPSVSVPAPPQLSPEHHRQLAAARKAVRKVRRTISVASFDGWTVGVFGLLTLLTGITDPSGIFMGLGMAAVAWVELRGAARLRQLDPRATRTLALNQIALASILTIYALWRLHAEMNGVSPYQAYKTADPQIARMLQPVENLTHLISLILYSAMIAVAFFAQGGMALFYFTRGKHIDAYLAHTPRWILEMQKSGVAL
jgi:hypothetical protein